MFLDPTLPWESDFHVIRALTLSLLPDRDVEAIRRISRRFTRVCVSYYTRRAEEDFIYEVVYADVVDRE